MRQRGGDPPLLSKGAVFGLWNLEGGFSRGGKGALSSKSSAFGQKIGKGKIFFSRSNSLFTFFFHGG